MLSIIKFSKLSDGKSDFLQADVNAENVKNNPVKIWKTFTPF